MKISYEVNILINERYDWVDIDKYHELKGCRTDSILGDCIENVDDFFVECKGWILDQLYDCREYKLYMIFNERLINPNSKVENYYKCWKKIEKENDLSGFCLGDEVKIVSGKDIYYSGIACTEIDNIESFLKLYDKKQDCYALFLADPELINNTVETVNFIRKTAFFDKMWYLDRNIFFSECIKASYIPMRYGRVYKDAILTIVS